MNVFIYHRSMYHSVYVRPKIGSMGSAYIWDQGIRGGWGGSPLDPEGSTKAGEDVQDDDEGLESSPQKAWTFISSLTSHPCFSMHNLTVWKPLKLWRSGQCQQFIYACDPELTFMFCCPVSNWLCTEFTVIFVSFGRLIETRWLQ